MASGKKEEFKITEEEVKQIGEALKDEKFRKLFLEYAEEIQNPENRKLYEQEISQLEQERGMNVEFIHPQPGHVLKTSVDGNVKAFINICQNDKIGKPVAKREISSEGKKGINWSIPHSHTPPRDDLDKSGQKCRVYDVVFHPDTYRMAQSNVRFRDLVEDTALEGITRQFGVKLDRKNLKRPKLSYKGTPTATVIRTKADNPPKTMDDDDPIKNMPYPFDDKTSEEKAKEMADAVKRKKEEERKKSDKTKMNSCAKEQETDATIPKYTITHRSDMDLQEFRNSPDSRPSTRPKELVLSIELPLLSSSKPVELDIFEQRLVLKSKEPVVYNLDLKLPYTVDDSQGSAKFDKSKRCLIVTLPVVPEKIPLLPSFIEESKMNSNLDDKKEGHVEKPLIEVLSTLESNIKLQNDEENMDVSNCISPAPKITYGFPQFEFSQDSETVTFIFDVKRIAHDSVSKLFPLPNVCHIKFISKGSGGFPLHYSFMAKFSAKNCFVPEQCSFDITDENAVLLLLKEKDSRHIWDMFEAGISLDELEEYQFETEWTLFHDLERLELECLSNSVQDKSVEVTEMTRKKLSIKIQSKSTGENGNSDITTPSKNRDADDELEEEEDECPLSADIEVVHEKGIPDLHGILKQRSISESSEDQSQCSGCSPESPREDFFKKSVKFNDKIDKTTYKTKAAVSSMTQALKSKRKRNRKKQEKRNRRNSGSSEGSSDEHKVSDDHNERSVESIEESTNEDVGIGQDKEGEIVNGKESRSVLEGVSTTEQADVNEIECDNSAQQIVGEVKEIDKQEKLVQDIKNKLAMSKEEEECDSDDEMDRNTVMLQESQESELCNKNVTDERTNYSQKKEENENTITVTSDVINNPSNLTNIIGTGESIIRIKAADKANGDDSGVELEGSGDKGDKSDVDTVLTWNDQQHTQEHRTECAFQFSNAMIYDLDVD